MRQLTVKQKKVLDQFSDMKSHEELPIQAWDKLTEINDTEILWSETNRYLSDNYKPTDERSYLR